MNNLIRLIDPDGMSVTPINGGYTFDGEDAQQAFAIVQASSRNMEDNENRNKKGTGSVATITFGKEKIWGEAMKALVPEAIKDGRRDQRTAQSRLVRRRYLKYL